MEIKIVHELSQETLDTLKLIFGKTAIAKNDAPAKEEKSAKTEKAEKPVKTEKAEKPKDIGLTDVDVRAIANQKSQDGFRDEVVALIKSYPGAEKLSDLKKEHYEDFVAKVKAIM